MQPLHVAIVGSRNYPRLELVRDFVRKLKTKYPDAILVSGRGRGVDQAAEEEADRVGLAKKIYPADWDVYGRAAGFLRNTTIVEQAQIVVAFWDGQSRGTLDTLTKARDAKKMTFIYDSAGNLLTDPPGS